MNSTKYSIQKKLSQIPLIKRLFHRTGDPKAEIRNKFSNKQLKIIRQGAPECFEDNSPLKIEWSLTSYCNYRCSYCFSVKKKKENDFCSLEQVENAIKYIASANRPGYQISLQGGEPTSHPDFASIVTLLCKYLGDRLESLLIITNGSFNEEQMETIIGLMDQYSIRVFVSIHLEFMSIDRVRYLVKRLSDHGLLIMTVMFQPVYFEKAKAVTDALCELRKDHPFEIEIKYIRTPPSFDRLDPRYTQEHFDWADAMKDRIIKVSAEGVQRDREYPKLSGAQYIVETRSNGESEIHHCESSDELLKMTGLDFRGLTCCAGTNVLSINSRGDAKGLMCNLVKPLCNIYEENPFQRDDWIHGVVCKRRVCGCHSSHRVPKFKSPAAAKEHIARVKKAQVCGAASASGIEENAR